MPYCVKYMTRQHGSVSKSAHFNEGSLSNSFPLNADRRRKPPRQRGDCQGARHILLLRRYAATSPPIKEVGPEIVLNTAFDDKQAVGAS